VTTTGPSRRTAHRPFRVAVSRRQRLSPTFVRITFTSAELVDFAADGLDQRIKVVLPHPENGFASFPLEGDWYGSWRELPGEERNPVRTYTARAIRPDRGEIDVDFVCHGVTGPASAWVERARPGDEVVIVGPDRTSGYDRVGVEWEPGGAGTVLLAGDETAAPAICSILESMPHDASGQVFIEVPMASDVLAVTAPRGIDVQWLPRVELEVDAEEGNAASPGDALVAAVRDWTSRFLTADHHRLPIDADSLAELDIDHDILWEVPAGSAAGSDFYAWLAGEAQAITTLRRFLVSEVGLRRDQVAFMGYWRLGKSEN
jgi:NADPH-dependent ferric siderophore reductase